MSARIVVVGLGPGRAEYISIGALEALRKAGAVFVRTRLHPAVAQLPTLGVSCESLDWVYETSEEMEQVYSRLAAEIIKAARQNKGTVVYAVPGHPLVAEASVSALLSQAKKEGLETEIIPSISSIELCLLRLGFDPLETLKVADAQSPRRIDASSASLFLQLDSQRVASELKIALLEAFPPEHEVTLLYSVGVPKEERIEKVPLAELDHRKDFNHLTSLFVPPLPASGGPAGFQDLVDIMARLRSENGCPWDKEQNHLSMRSCLEEETREVLEAIEKQDPKALCEELGDLLLQVLFHARLAAEAGEFNIADVLQGLQNKLIERHPHVFGEEKIETASEVLEVWEALKRKRKPRRRQDPAPPAAEAGKN
jgi:tetrapyrrole methylase family protein/MazG family protein